MTTSSIPTIASINYLSSNNQTFHLFKTPKRLKGDHTRPPTTCKDIWNRIVYYAQFGERLNYVQLTHKGGEEFTINLAPNSDVWTKYLPTLLALYIDVTAYEIVNSKPELGNLSKLVRGLSAQMIIPQVVLVFAKSDLKLTGAELKKVSPSVPISCCTFKDFDTAVDQVVDAHEASICAPRKSARNL